MEDKAFQALITEEIRAMRMELKAFRTEFTKFRTEDYTNFKVEVAEDKGFQKGKSYWTAGVVSVITSAIVSFFYKIAFK